MPTGTTPLARKVTSPRNRLRGALFLGGVGFQPRLIGGRHGISSVSELSTRTTPPNRWPARHRARGAPRGLAGAPPPSPPLGPRALRAARRNEGRCGRTAAGSASGRATWCATSRASPTTWACRSAGRGRRDRAGSRHARGGEGAAAHLPPDRDVPPKLRPGRRHHCASHEARIPPALETPTCVWWKEFDNRSASREAALVLSLKSSRSSVASQNVRSSGEPSTAISLTASTARSCSSRHSRLHRCCSRRRTLQQVCR